MSPKPAAAEPTNRLPDRLPIAFVVSTLVTGGAERQLQHLITHLDRRHYAPRLYTLRGLGAIGEELRDAGIPATTRIGPGRPPEPWAPLTLARALRRDQVRAVYCLDHTNAVVVAALATWFMPHLPLLVAIHTTGQWGRASIPRPMRAMLGRVDRLLSIAEAQKQYLIAHEGIAAEKIDVIRNGIPPLDPPSLPEPQAARATLGLPIDAGPVIGILAMLRPEKAHENFLAAAQQLLARLPRAHFLCVGGGPRQPELEALATELGIAAHVHFLGVRDDVPQILPAFDVSVLASHPRVETLPLSQMEAMSLGIPVVATRVGALHELIEDGVEGALVPHGDPAALAEAIYALAADPQRLRAAGHAARQRVLREFTADRVARETAALIKKLARERRAR